MKRFFYKSTSLWCLALASASALYSCQPEEFTPSAELKATQVSNHTAKQFVDGQYIVVFKKDKKKTREIVNSLVANMVITPLADENIMDGVISGFVSKLTAAQVAWLKKLAYVDYVEQDQYIYSQGGPAPKTTTTKTTTTTTTTTTTRTPSPTSPTMVVLAGETIPQGVQMMGYADGTGKTAWVIDSGVDVNNTDLNVDVARSVSFLTTTTSVQDGYGHGTAVASIIGAKNNGSGLIGVAPNTAIVALRVMDNAGAGVASAAIKAVNHVGTYGKVGDVVNLSLSTPASTTFDTAVKNVAAKGIFIAIAAGNSNTDCTTTSPQRVSATNIYTISAMDYNKYFWSASSWGAPVDRCAPGVNITVAMIGGGTKTGSGTSYAAPHVAGLLLLKGNNMANIGYVTGDKDRYPDLIPHL